MRREARELALQILFQTEFSPSVSTSDIMGLFEEKVDRDVVSYADILIEGVTKFRKELDNLVQSFSQHWKIDRMSTVDRNILRIAIFEMKFSSEKIKPNIAINEAVEIAKKYSTNESSSFVNGILDQVGRGL